MPPTFGNFDYVNLICGELGGFRRGKHSAALFHNSNQDVRVAVHGSGDDEFKHIDGLLSNPNTKRKTWERLDSKIQT